MEFDWESESDPVEIIITDPDPVEISDDNDDGIGGEITTSNYSGWEISCVGEEDGWISAAAIGGSGNYTYTLFTASGQLIEDAEQQSAGTFINLEEGVYIVQVDDQIDGNNSEELSLSKSLSSSVITLLIEPQGPSSLRR